MTGAFGRSPAYKWIVVGALWCVCLLNYADRQTVFSVFPLLKSELRLTDVQLGIVGASFMWVYALFGPVAGWLCDRVARKTVDHWRARVLISDHGIISIEPYLCGAHRMPCAERTRRSSIPAGFNVFDQRLPRLRDSLPRHGDPSVRCLYGHRYGRKFNRMDCTALRLASEFFSFRRAWNWIRTDLVRAPLRA